MIATGYLIIEGSYDTEGKVRSFPRTLKLNVEIPDELLEPTSVKVLVDEEYLLARKPVRVFVVKDED